MIFLAFVREDQINTPRGGLYMQKKEIVGIDGMQARSGRGRGGGGGGRKGRKGKKGKDAQKVNFRRTI